MTTAEDKLEGTALATAFDDSDASDEVLALRAWVAGLADELGRARRERDEAQHALAAMRAELERLRAALADEPRAAVVDAGSPGDGPSQLDEPAASTEAHEAGMVAPQAATGTADAAATSLKTSARRVRLLATVVLLLLVAAAIAVAAGPRLLP